MAEMKRLLERVSPDEVDARLCKILACYEDDEEAHKQEKDLWDDALTAIALGHENPRELASMAIKTKELDFNRWFS